MNLIFCGKPGRLQNEIREFARRLPSLKITYTRRNDLRPPNGFLVGLDEKGESFSTLEFSNFLDRYNKKIVFVVGDDLSLPDWKYQRLLRLSDFTLPHDLARLVLVEQIYRAHTLSKNHPYHHA